MEIDIFSFFETTEKDKLNVIKLIEEEIIHIRKSISFERWEIVDGERQKEKERQVMEEILRGHVRGDLLELTPIDKFFKDLMKARSEVGLVRVPPPFVALTGDRLKYPLSDTGSPCYWGLANVNFAFLRQFHQMVVWHEMGHFFGIKENCTTPSCLMRWEGGRDFCPKCIEALKTEHTEH